MLVGLARSCGTMLKPPCTVCMLRNSRDLVEREPQVHLHLSPEAHDMGLCMLTAAAGDGHTSCKATAALTALAVRYVTDGAGRLACAEGQSLAYPVAAPGFVYDPTGSTQASASHAVRTSYTV